MNDIDQNLYHVEFFIIVDIFKNILSFVKSKINEMKINYLSTSILS